MNREQSLKSDHELRQDQDLMRTELLRTDMDELDLEDAAKQTAVEYEDASMEELKAFKSRLPDPSKYCRHRIQDLSD